MQKLFFISMLFVALNSFGQINFVPNDNFEQRLSDDLLCGTFLCGSCTNESTGQGCCCCSRDLKVQSVILSNQVIIPFVKEWGGMYNHSGTSDYYHKCSDQDADVPNNKQGSQKPHSINAYAGLIARTAQSSFKDYTEYLQIKLDQKLVQDKEYKVQMYVSLADKSRYASAGLSFLVTKNRPNGNGQQKIQGQFNPQVVSNKIISNKNSWTKISGNFKAKGGEEYLTIGVFDKNLSSFNLICSSCQSNDAYYYIDDVSLIGDPPPDSCCCPRKKLYEDDNNLPELTSVQEFIKAGKDVGIPNISGPVIVKSDDEVIFRAGDSIVLEPGFDTELGAEFTAEIEPCTNNTKSNQIGALLPSIFDRTKCHSDEYCIWIKNANCYEFEVWTGFNGELLHKESGVTKSNWLCVWDGTDDRTNTCVQQDTYIGLLTLHNCGRDTLIQRFITVTPTGSFAPTSSKTSNNTSNSTNTVDTNKTDTFPVNNNELFYILNNPSSTSTVLIFNISSNSEVKITLHNITEQYIKRVLYDSYTEKGQHKVNLKTSELHQGIYTVSFKSENHFVTKKLIVIK